MFHKLLKPHTRRFILRSAPWLIVAIIGLIFSIGSSYSAYQVWSYQPLTLIPNNTQVSSLAASGSSGLKKNLVEISGAVTRPGVYEVSDGSRWQEVLLMANGFSDSADKRFVHQELNLAEKVKDQAKLYIPFASDSAILAATGKEIRSTSSSSVLNVNTVSGDVWDEIEGIGEAKVKSILAGMPYTDKKDFLDRSGISPAVYSHIEEKYIEIMY